MEHVRRGLWVALFGVVLVLAPGLRAETIIDEWASVPEPPPPALKPATVDAKTTALLVLDLLQQNCGKRPRCFASIPAVTKLLAAARSKGMAVIYTYFPGATKADLLPQIAPQDGEPVMQAPSDKFLGSDLDKMLKDKGAKSIIIVGTAANGGVLYTASEAALRGFNVIVPVDGMSGDSPYPEKLTVWQLANASVIDDRVTLTTIDMIHF